MSAWIDWLKVIQLQPRFLFGFWFLGGLILFLPIGIAETLGIQEARIGLRSWIGFGTLAAFAFWLVQLYPEYQKYRAARMYRKQVIRALSALCPEEWVMLGYCLDQNQQTITPSIADSVAGALLARGLLERPTGVGTLLAWPHTIPDFVWDYLKAHRDDFLRNPPFPQEQINARFNGLHKHLHRHDF
jgi:hypothetical protein